MGWDGGIGWNGKGGGLEGTRWDGTGRDEMGVGWSRVFGERRGETKKRGEKAIV